MVTASPSEQRRRQSGRAKLARRAAGKGSVSGGLRRQAAVPHRAKLGACESLEEGRGWVLSGRLGNQLQDRRPRGTSPSCTIKLPYVLTVVGKLGDGARHR